MLEEPLTTKERSTKYSPLFHQATTRSYLHGRAPPSLTELWIISPLDSYEKKPETLSATAEKDLKTTRLSSDSPKLNHSQAPQVLHHRATLLEAGTDQAPTLEEEERERDAIAGTIDSKHLTATPAPLVGALTATSSVTKNETAGTS